MECVRCKEDKNSSEFYEGYTHCKKCQIKYSKSYYKRNTDRSKKARRSWRLKSKYGLTDDEYNQMYISQNKSCAICESKTPGKRVNNFSVDHCHETGVIRGLLCVRCNVLLGRLNDDLEFINKIVKYLKKN